LVSTPDKDVADPVSMARHVWLPIRSLLIDRTLPDADAQ
jgi:hypothetical protein